MLAYAGTFFGPLIFDDIPAIADNSSLHHWGRVLAPPLDCTAAGRPFLNLSFAINYAVSGTHVWSYHVFNLGIHILAALTLLGILRQVFQRFLVGSLAKHAAFSAALLWAVHPVNTESVTYIVQRAESLMGLFYLITLYCFIRGTEKRLTPQRGWFIIAFAACLLGIATKEVMVSAPLMVLVYDRTFVSGSFRAAWLRRWKVYASLFSTWVPLAWLALSAHNRGGSAGFGESVAFSKYFGTQFPALVRYLKLSVWPHPLVFYYGTPWVSHFASALPSIVAVVGLAVAGFWAFVRRGFISRSFGFAAAWFFAILAPTSLVPIIREPVAEHRMYLALIPIVVLAVIGIYRLCPRQAFVTCLAGAAGLLALTYRRNEDYRSGVRIWADTVAKSPQNAYAHYNLGIALGSDPRRLAAAMTQYREALRLMPNLIAAQTNLAHDLLAEGRTTEAIGHLAAVVRVKPASPSAHNNLGEALLRIPQRWADAEAQFQTALHLDPANFNAQLNLGNLYSDTGQLALAIKHIEAALQQRPDSAPAHYNLANVLRRIHGRLKDAIAEYQISLRLNPAYAEAHNNLGDALAAVGRTAEAATQFATALQLRPNYAEAHNNLGMMLIREGKFTEAIRQYELALRIHPRFAAAEFHLANALAVQPGRAQEAIAHYEAAIRLQSDYPAARYNLAVALLRLDGRPDLAAKQLEVALRLHPGFASARTLLNQIRSATHSPPP